MTRSRCGVERLPSPKLENFLPHHAVSADLLARTRRPEAARSRRNRLLYEAFGRAASAIALRSAADEPGYLSGITISRSLVSTTNMASNFAGAVVLAFWLIW
jgi:hypothetical protein